MSLFSQLLEFFGDADNWSGSRGIPVRMLEHLWYTALSLAIATAIALPVGLLIGHTGRGAFFAINLGNAARSFPSLGLLMLLVLGLGLGLVPALIALVALGVPPILASTYAGVRGVEPAVIDAARGMGMTETRIVSRVELPIALPLVLSGMRSATLQIVSTATIAAYLSLGGLGRFVIDGFAVRDYAEMVAGAVLVALLAIALDGVLVLLQRLLVSAGLTGRAQRAAATQEPTAEPAAELAH
ncbi:ABC transporter permease [Prauserella muralis]|uniref:Glycine/betaine ABC transporter permease n=1 Tax=Prauserella muralis TaxID=588067 RepID=A0A2V4ARG2_9PSEU|nr:ABC transporter permease [Prauserella muralis]PXY22959.1 glycine/betaine ABC transporter permease [Prauserella muralis]